MAGFAGLVLLFLTVSGYSLILSPPFIIGDIMCVWVIRGLTKPSVGAVLRRQRGRGRPVGELL